MIKRIFKTIGIATVISAAFSFAALAATAINSVNFTYTIDGNSAITAGYNEPTVELVSQDMYTVSDLTCTSDTSLATGKTALSYTLTLSAKRNYNFPAVNQIQVSGSNITQLVKTSVDSSDKSLLTIKFKAYPFFSQEAPAFVTNFDDIKGSKSKTEEKGRAAVLTIDKKGASKIEYVISYVDQNGEIQSKAGTTTGSSISVSPYNKRYTGTSAGKQSAYIRGIAMRAAGNQGANPNSVPSDWVYINGGITSIDTEEYYTNYTTWDDFRFEGNSGSTSNSGTYVPTNSNVNVIGWQGSGDTWYFYNNGTKVKGWIYDGSHWYYCDPNSGLMKSGWILDGGYWYFLNTSHDGTFGCMKTGWLVNNGATYYLRPNAGGPQGSMVTGSYTVNGRTYNFTNSGALIG